MKFFSSAANLFKIPELRRRIIFTALCLIVYRVGSYIPMPGVDTHAIRKAIEARAGREGSIVARVEELVNLFAGGALDNCSPLGLGIMPYISASIIFQLLVTVIKPLEELQKEGEAGRRRINQYTRYATVGLCLVQSVIVARWLERMGSSGVNIVPPEVAAGFGFELQSMVLLTAGSIFVMWLGEQITEDGIGNGASIIIMISIVSRMPVAVYDVFYRKFDWAHPFTPIEGKYGIVTGLLLVGMYVAVVLGVVIITQGQRRITVQQSKHTRGRRVYGGQRHYMPLRVNQAGVIPIIFAQSLIQFPSTIIISLAGLPILYQLFGYGGFFYTLIYIALIFFFSFFWTAVVFNPVNMADDMKKHGHIIPGIPQGAKTAKYLEKRMVRVTLAGAAFLSIIAILPMLMNKTTEVGWLTASLYGGTGLLIVVGVALDMVQKVEQYMIMRHYEGFMGSTRVRGRVG